MKKFLALFTSVAVALAMAGCNSGTSNSSTSGSGTSSSTSTSNTTSQSEAEIIIRLADVQAENDIETQFEYRFAELVSEKSGGRIEVQVYPAGQMGEMADILSSVQMGSIEMTRTNPSWLADAGAGSMNLLSLPFVFEDLESANKVLESEVGDSMLQELTDKSIGVYGLGYLEPSGRYFFFKDKEVSSLEDIADLKIRVQTNSLATAMVESLGASATPIL